MISFAITHRVNTALISATATLMIVLAIATTAHAQAGSRSMPPTSVERRNEVLTRQAGEYEIEKSARDLKGRPADRAGEQRVNELGIQIRHDFESLQNNYNHLVLLMNDKRSFERQGELVLRAVVEIKKSASRLKTNLALPKLPHDKHAVGIEARSNEDALLQLRKHIYDFVTNPLFESPAVLNVDQGKQASRDLDGIIELSQNITKRAN